MKTPITAADLLNDRVVPLFEQHDVSILRILADRGTEFCGRPELRTRTQTQLPRTPRHRSHHQPSQTETNELRVRDLLLAIVLFYFFADAVR